MTTLKDTNRKFYIKQSKNKLKNIISELKDLKLRLIVGGPKCPTRKLSNFLDLILLKPLTKHVRSNIKDNIEYLKTCQRNVTDGTVFGYFRCMQFIHQYTT